MNFGDSSHTTMKMRDCLWSSGAKMAPLSWNRVKEIIDQKMAVQIIDAFNHNLLTVGLAKAVLEKTFGPRGPLVISNFYLRFRVSKGS